MLTLLRGTVVVGTVKGRGNSSFLHVIKCSDSRNTALPRHRREGQALGTDRKRKRSIHAAAWAVLHKCYVSPSEEEWCMYSSKQAVFTRHRGTMNRARAAAGGNTGTRRNTATARILRTRCRCGDRILLAVTLVGSYGVGGALRRPEAGERRLRTCCWSTYGTRPAAGWPRR